MTGHGSPPPDDRANDPARRVHEVGEATASAGHRPSGVMIPGPSGPGMAWTNRQNIRSEHFRVEGGREPKGGFHNRVLMVKSQHRAKVAAHGLASRAASGRDLYSGRPL